MAKDSGRIVRATSRRHGADQLSRATVTASPGCPHRELVEMQGVVRWNVLAPTRTPRHTGRCCLGCPQNRCHHRQSTSLADELVVHATLAARDVVPGPVRCMSSRDRPRDLDEEAIDRDITIAEGTGVVILDSEGSYPQGPRSGSCGPCRPPASCPTHLPRWPDR